MSPSCARYEILRTRTAVVEGTVGLAVATPESNAARARRRAVPTAARVVLCMAYET
jgi:hypothetical protein